MKCIICPKCKLLVSDTIKSCPSCGSVFDGNEIGSQLQSSELKVSMKKPADSFVQEIKQKGNPQNPFAKMDRIEALKIFAYGILIILIPTILFYLGGDIEDIDNPAIRGWAKLFAVIAPYAGVLVSILILCGVIYNFICSFKIKPIKKADSFLWSSLLNTNSKGKRNAGQLMDIFAKPIKLLDNAATFGSFMNQLDEVVYGWLRESAKNVDLSCRLNENHSYDGEWSDVFFTNFINQEETAVTEDLSRVWTNGRVGYSKSITLNPNTRDAKALSIEIARVNIILDSYYVKTGKHWYISDSNPEILKS